MPRSIVPPLKGLALLPNPLTSDEYRLLELFNTSLSDDWEIYVHPHLNGLRPTFVLLNDKIGIGVFEVAEASEQGMQEPSNGNPVRRIDATKRAIRDLYCPRLGLRLTQNEKLQALITAGVLVTDATTHDALRRFNQTRRDLGHFKRETTHRYHPVAGRDALEKRYIKAIFPEGMRPYSTHMDPVYARDLRTWLKEPDHDEQGRRHLQLDGRQRLYATTRTKSGYRWITGPAGSGKSIVLAARASELSAEGKEVLVVSFNITLWHYLFDLAARHPNPNRHLVDRVTWTHFHLWCKSVLREAYFKPERAAEEQGNRSLDERYITVATLLGGDDAILSPDPDDDNTDLWLEKDLPELVGETIDTALACGHQIQTYDAILIDEGQDFNLAWLDILHKVLRPGGEMLLTSDHTQDLYGRAARWTPEQLRSIMGKFRKPVTLQESHRLPPAIVEPLRMFADTFLRDAVPPVKPRQEQLDLWGRTQWLQVLPGPMAVETTVEAVLSMPSFADPTLISYSDVTLLVQDHEFGLACVDQLSGAGIQVAHIFAPTPEEQRPLKMAFFMGDGSVKATTIKSFKGWEGRAIVLYIGRASRPSDLAEIYVGLSRLKKHDDGAFLTVICSAIELEQYARSTWPNFALRVPSSKPSMVYVT